MTTTATDSELDLVNRLRQLFNSALKERENRHPAWIRNYRLTMNIIGTWTSNVRQPSTRLSAIYPNLAVIVSWMNDQQTTIDITAAADPGSPFSQFYQNVAQNLGDVMESLWAVEQYDQQKKLYLWDGLIYGTGFSKTIWDQSLAGGLGNPKIIHIDPFKLYLDPKANAWEDIEYLVEKRDMSLNEIERRFPGKSTLIEGMLALEETTDKPTYTSDAGIQRVPKASPGNLGGYSGGAFGSSTGTTGGNAGSQTRWASPNSSGPPRANMSAYVTVYEYWIKENDEWYEDDRVEDNKENPGAEPPPAVLTTKRVAERWRVVIMAANTILMDEYADDLWSYGGHPYDRFVFDDVGEIYGIGLVDHLAHPQVALNRVLLSLQQNIELTGNPIAVIPTNAGLGRRGFSNKPGQVLDVNPAALQSGGRGMDWLRPPEPTQASMEIIKFYLEQIDNICGLSDVKKQSSPQDRRSSDQFSMTAEVSFVRIRNALQNLESMLRSAGYKVADLIIDNYTTPRYIAISGPSAEQSSLALRARHFNVPTERGAEPLKYVLDVKGGADQPTSRQARTALANFAYNVGLVDRQGWFELTGAVPNWQAIDARIKELEKTGNWSPPSARQRRQKSAGGK